MDILKNCFSSSYRKRRWAAQHLKVYREDPLLLIVHKVRRNPLVFVKIVKREYEREIRGLVDIPKFSQISGEDLMTGKL